MYAPKRVAATLAAVAALAAAAPTVASAATLPSFGPNPNLCLSNVYDPGPLGPTGPYGPSGPYGPNGPLHGQPNPVGNVATCGGGLTYILRGGTIGSFVQANVASATGH
jgi:hypothetical protein